MNIASDRKEMNVSKRYTRQLYSLALSIVAAVSLVGCSQGPLSAWSNGAVVDSGSSSSSLDPLANGYETAAMAILQSNCTSCHTASSGYDNVYDVTDPVHLISSGLVVPGSATTSTLYTQISAGTMPPGGGLSAADVATINSWIMGGDGSTGGGSTGPAVSFATISTNIFQAKCVSCHSATQKSGGYEFDTYAGVLAAVNTAYPTTSTMYVQVNTGAMPLNGTALSAVDQTSILTWIQQGALNN